jgi:hypothetical protein
MLERFGALDGERLPARLWMRAALGRRRHDRAIARGEYQHRGVFGHSILAELRVPAG